MAWPPIVADNVDVVSAAHINSIVAAVQTWQGPVNANGQALNSVSTLTTTGKAGIGRSPIADLHVSADNCFVAFENKTDAVDSKIWDIHFSGSKLQLRAVDDTYATASAGMEIFRSGTSVILVRFPNGAIQMDGLQAANPGAGQHRLWYDPADGNRVKFAP